METLPRWTVPTPRGVLELARPWVMGVLNVTPDSFSDGGSFDHQDAALERARQVCEQGARILDVGGESTRPGASPVSPQDEQARVLPLIRELAARKYPLPISIDTRRAEVAHAAVLAGASVINDVSGLADPDMLRVVAELEVPVVVGHIQGTPESMQAAPRYRDVVAEVFAYLLERRDQALAAGVPLNQILLDPGIGFGKTLEHNLDLLVALPDLAEVAPVVVGVSRKRMIGALLAGRPVDQRTHGSVGGAVSAALAGASIIRVHDVQESVDALRVAWAIEARRLEKEASDPCGAP
ncbi:MAG: dihydropteroate synthase [Planctomycetota bacterium]